MRCKENNFSSGAEKAPEAFWGVIMLVHLVRENEKNVCSETLDQSDLLLRSDAIVVTDFRRC